MLPGTEAGRRSSGESYITCQTTVWIYIISTIEKCTLKKYYKYFKKFVIKLYTTCCCMLVRSHGDTTAPSFGTLFADESTTLFVFMNRMISTSPATAEETTKAC